MDLLITSEHCGLGRYWNIMAERLTSITKNSTSEAVYIMALIAFSCVKNAWRALCCSSEVLESLMLHYNISYGHGNVTCPTLSEGYKQADPRYTIMTKQCTFTGQALNPQPEIRMPKDKALDWAWVHGTVVVEGDLKGVKCNYCSQVFRGGITYLKRHLARIQGCCPSVPKAVMNGCRENFEDNGPDKTMMLKSNQKMVPLCEGDDGIVEEPERRTKSGKAVDSAWLHGTAVVEGNFRQIRCNYCLKVLNTTITGLKKHLAKIDVNFKACPSVPQVVSDGFRDNFEERGPNKILTLKSNQKKVPLFGDPTNVDIDDGKAEESGEHSANAGPTLLVTKSQSSPSNSGHTAFMDSMSATRGKTGKEVAERVAERGKVNLTKRDRSQVRTRNSDFNLIINVEDSSGDDETGPHTSQTDSQVRIHTPSAHNSSDCIQIFNVEDRSSDDEIYPHTSLTATLSKKRRIDKTFGPHQGLHLSDTSRPSTNK